MQPAHLLFLLLPTLVVTVSAGDISAGDGERGIASSAVSKLKGFLRKNTDMIAGVKQMPIVQKLETAVKNNPHLVKQLSKNPESIKKLENNNQVQKISMMLEQHNVKVNKERINQLRSVAGNDPLKLRSLDAVDAISGGRGWHSVVTGAITLGLLFAAGWAIGRIAGALIQN